MRFQEAVRTHLGANLKEAQLNTNMNHVGCHITFLRLVHDHCIFVLKRFQSNQKKLRLVRTVSTSQYKYALCQQRLGFFHVYDCERACFHCELTKKKQSDPDALNYSFISKNETDIIDWNKIPNIQLVTNTVLNASIPHLSRLKWQAMREK